MPSRPPAARKARKPRAAARSTVEADTPPEAVGELIGHNQPPEEVAAEEPKKTPLEIMTAAVDDLYLEATNWLDGEPISNEEQAGRLTELKGRLEEAVKTVETERKAVADPVYKVWKGINADWKPVSEKAEKAVKVARNALTPWLLAVAAENKRKADEAEELRKAKEDELRRAREAAATAPDLATTDAAEDAEAEFKQATRDASYARKETSTVRTDSGRASLRTYWFVKFQDAKDNPKARMDLLKHYLSIDPDWVAEIVLARAQREVTGGTRNLPGCIIWDEQRAI